MLHLQGSSHWTSGRTRWSSVAGTISVKVPGEVSVENARVGSPKSQVVLFDAALVDLTCEPSGARAFTFSAAVARSRALLNERLTETVTLDELATHARLDKFRLCRAFRDEVGLPPR